MKKDNLFVFDKRLQERNIRSGAITPKDLEAYMKNLPDISDKMQNLFDEPEVEQETEEQENEVTE